MDRRVIERTGKWLVSGPPLLYLILFFAAPTLIKRLPEPLRRLIGDMSDEQRVLVGLDIRSKRARPING